MLIPLVVTPFHHLACVRLVFLHCRIREQPHVIMHVKVEQRAGFATGFVQDEVVERVVLAISSISTPTPQNK